jgi:hypothetical protein
LDKASVATPEIFLISSTIIKQQTENMKEIKDENFQLKNYLKTQRKELTVLKFSSTKILLEIS